VNNNNGSVMGSVFFSPFLGSVSQESFLSGRPLPARPGNHHKPLERSLV
jgi:hypothetical protein